MALLAFLSGLATTALCGPTATDVFPNQAYAASSKSVAAGPICQGDVCNASDAVLSREAEIAPTEDFGLALEDNDSIHLFRIEIRQRAVRLDRKAVGLTISLKNARNLHATISPPLLV